MIRLGTSADLPAAACVYRRASLSNAGDRDNLLAHPAYLILGPEGLAEGRTHVAEEDGSVVGFATWAGPVAPWSWKTCSWTRPIGGAGSPLHLSAVSPGSCERGAAERLEVTANPHALGFYRVVGFIECGVAETDPGAAPRMVLVLS